MTMLCIVQHHKALLTPSPILYEDALRLARRTAAAGAHYIVRVYEAGPDGDRARDHHGHERPRIFEAWAGAPGEWWWCHVRDGYRGEPQPGQSWQLQEPASPLP